MTGALLLSEVREQLAESNGRFEAQLGPQQHAVALEFPECFSLISSAM